MDHDSSGRVVSGHCTLLHLHQNYLLDSGSGELVNLSEVELKVVLRSEPTTYGN